MNTWILTEDMVDEGLSMLYYDGKLSDVEKIAYEEVYEINEPQVTYITSSSSSASSSASSNTQQSNNTSSTNNTQSAGTSSETPADSNNSETTTSVDDSNTSSELAGCTRVDGGFQVKHSEADITLEDLGGSLSQQ